MRIVGIDTATSVASVALIENGQLIAEQRHPAGHPPINSPRANHAETLLPLIRSVLESASVSLTEVTGFAVSIGPGSFTGLRIGLSTIKGLAYGWRIPVVGVSTLLATAARVTDYDGFICSLLDARKGEVYAALFRRTGDTLIRLTDDRVGLASAVLEMLGAIGVHESCLFIGDGASVYGKLLVDFLGPRARVISAEGCPTAAAAIARLSERRFQRADVNDLGSLVPLYVRRPEAESKRANSM